jgi:hypothetical protein
LAVARVSWFRQVVAILIGREASMIDPDLARFVEFLNRAHIRATYDAVAQAAGVPTRSVGRLLGDKCPEASWVVNGATGEPTGYDKINTHPALHENAEIIRTGTELIRRVRAGK